MKLSWRFALVMGAMAVFAAIVVFNWKDVKETIGVIGTIRWPILLLIPAVQTLSFYSNAKYYQSFLASFGYKLPTATLFRLALALNFVNQISPSAGLTGVTFFSYGLKGEVSAGKSTLVQYGRYVLTSVSFVFLLVFGLFTLYFGGGIDKIIVRIVVALVLSTVVLASVFLGAFSSKDRFNKLVYWVQRCIDWLSGLLRKGKPLLGKERVRKVLEEFHDGIDVLIRERRHLGRPFFYALMGNVMEVVTLYIVFIALGVWVNPGAVIISYAAASATAVVSIIPGDVGVYELTSVAVLSSTGVPVAVALTATLIYRVLNKTLFLPPGFYYYSKFIRKKQLPKADSN